MGKRILYLLMSAVLAIPAYPGSRKMWEQKMQSNGMDITLIQYQSSDPASRIIDFYVDWLLKQNWFLNHRSEDPPTVYLTGQDRSQLTISCKDMLNRGINDIVIVHSTGITQEMLEAMTMDVDFPGKDIDSIPRYPGSIRKYFVKTDKLTNIIYESKQNCLDCVLRFYRAEMVARGWRASKEIKINPSEALQPLLKQGDLAVETKDYIAGLSKYPMQGFSFRNNQGEALIGVTQREGAVYITIHFIPKR